MKEEKETELGKRRSRSREAFERRRREKKEREKGKNTETEETVGKGSGAEETRVEGVHHGSRSGNKWIILISLSAAVFFLASLYIWKAVGYRETYFPHTMVNQIDVSGKTVEEVKDLISQEVKGYSLTLKLRDGKEERISGEQFGLHTGFDGSLEEIMRQQNPFKWPRYLLKGPSYDIQTMISYDEARLKKELEALSCFDPEKAVWPRDAYLSEYISGEGYSIIPEEEGTALDLQRTEAMAKEAVESLKGQLDLEEMDCYIKPSVLQEDPGLIEARDARNRYVNQTVTYMFGDCQEILDGDTISQWLVENGNGCSLEQEKVRAYVKELASKYDTAYRKRTFETSYGASVEVSGFYGWRIDQAKETAGLLQVLEEGQSVTREPVYLQKGASRDGADYGNTYAEVNLTAQHMFLYKEGKKVMESDFVSGNVSRGHATPAGICSLTYKQRNAVLRGEGYASPVKFWMPFNGGIGFHDASWRSSFGGSIYKTGGSHGCINMPYSAAKELFEHVYAGMPVICYHLPGTESSAASQSSGKPSQPQPPAVQPPQSQTPTQQPQLPPSQPAQSQPMEVQPTQTDPAQSQPPAQQPTEPSVSIQPVDPQAPASTESTLPPETSQQRPEGYGPGFESHEETREVGPGVS